MTRLPSPVSRLPLFITGTDTGIGKTRVACALLAQARAEGLRACGMKPVASGCARTPHGLRNDDALALQAAAGTDEPYERINPYAFEPAIAPHLAALDAGVAIEPGAILDAQAQLARRYELIVVEGVGGWAVPVNGRETLGDWVGAWGWPVLLVVGMRLGCLNHALLSARAIPRLCGWVANALPPEQERLKDNLETLRACLPAPLWGVARERLQLQVPLTALLDISQKTFQ